MTRRRLLLLAAFAVLLVAGPFVVLWATTPAIVPGVTLENFKRLHVGMELKEIEATLGPAKERYSNYPMTWGYRWSSAEGNVFILAGEHEGGLRALNGSGLCLWVHEHDANYPLAPYPETILDKIRRWLGL